MWRSLEQPCQILRARGRRESQRFWWLSPGCLKKLFLILIRKRIWLGQEWKEEEWNNFKHVAFGISIAHQQSKTPTGYSEACSHVKMKLETTWSINSTSGYMPTGITSRDSNRYLYTHVHNSTIHYSQQVAMTQGPLTDTWKHVERTSNGILFSLKKKYISDTCSKMDEPRRYYPK